MEMQQVRYFLALSRTLNFTRAAEECNVSQSALTRAIQALEAELGGELIRREHNRSHLTDLGKRMLPLLERCFESAITAKTLAKSIAGNLKPLSFAASHSVNAELLMPPISEMFGRFPGLHLTLLRGGGADILTLLKDGAVDLAIAGPLEDTWERLDCWKLFEEPFDLAVRSDHPLGRDNEITLDKLKGVPIFRQSGCELRETSARIFESGGISTTQIHEAVTQHDVLSLVAGGFGAAILPRSAPQAADVIRLPVNGLSLVRSVSVYAVAGRRREPAAAAFLNLLRSADYSGPAISGGQATRRKAATISDKSARTR